MKYSSLKQCKTPTVLLVLLALFMTPTASLAEFALNFMPESRHFDDPEWLAFNCNRPRAGGGDWEECDKNDLLRDNNGRDSTAFLFERVRDPNSSDQYYHTIIGMPGSDFVQEAYIKITRYYADDDCDNGCSPRSTPAEVDDLGPISDSLGDWRDIDKYANNAYDPMGPATFSGSGTANPKSTQFRQVMAGDGFEQDMTKAAFNKKPKLNQELNQELNHGILASFELDMTNSSYDQADIAGVMTRNYVKVTADGPGGSSPIAFDITDGFYQDRGGFDITGGKFRYDSLYSSTINRPTSSLQNEYSGEGAGYNIWNEDWKKYYDTAQNTYLAPPRDGDDDDRGPRGHLYGCTDECGSSKVYQPWEGGRTWSSWSSNRLSND